MPNQTIKISAVLGVIATLAAIGTAGNQFWPSIGWTTPATHAADIERITAEADDSTKEILDAIRESQDEWKCDEYEEELQELLEDQANGDDSMETALTIDKIRRAMERRDCSRFDDFG